jgi:hypothetical protein
MVLDQVDSDFLEKEIKRAVVDVKSTIGMARDERYREFTLIANEPDFTFGWSLGQIVRGFSYFFLIRHGRAANESEMEEVISRVSTRSKEIKDAIFSSFQH